ncbi:F-box domain-containing protein [Caenorhabditis elegans]|uniref:F-box domain-containing protein n=1 Tax=Caenorhabditis elegans TaxID=6239 RepID=Q9TZ26_CAEEL|nr:F-box domain-containing protein [Caenorhabditis elegans]CCD73259.1 F-box domain-containing protein [Caenorhabditis elegans]|eukprot:NP_497300.1 F-box A protein [Caenorhabditis elegans]
MTDITVGITVGIIVGIWLVGKLPWHCLGATIPIRHKGSSRDIAPKTHQKNLVLPTFLNMPLNIANLVLEKMELKDLLKARKVCRSLRTAVDKFGLRFDQINLFLGRDNVEICMRGTTIRYTTAANGNSNVTHNGQKTIIAEENFVERAAKDFKILSKHARKIDIRNFTENRRDIIKTFNEIWNTEKCILVKEIRLRHFSFDEVLTNLPWFNAKKLKTIELNWMKSIDRFERITQLEQWKNAEVVKIGSKIASIMIVHFFHFKCFTINHIDEFPAQAAIQMRDDLLRRSTFQSCYIIFYKSKTNPIEIAKVFKPDYTGENVFNIEYSNGNDKFDISLQEFSYYFLLNMNRSLSV